MQQIFKDIVKATSIFITQIFSVVNFHKILYSSYFTSKPYNASTTIFAILFSSLYFAKMFFLIKDLVDLKKSQKPSSSKSKNNT